VDEIFVGAVASGTPGQSSQYDITVQSAAVGLTSISVMHHVSDTRGRPFFSGPEVLFGLHLFSVVHQYTGINSQPVANELEKLKFDLAIDSRHRRLDGWIIGRDTSQIRHGGNGER
jgi:hypothetical protein